VTAVSGLSGGEAVPTVLAQVDYDDLPFASLAGTIPASRGRGGACMQDQLTFAMTVLGFALSTIAAWPILSKWGISLKNVSFGMVRRYFESKQATLDLAGSDSSYLIAFVARNLLFAFFLWIVKASILPYVATVPPIEWVSRLIPLFVGGLVGSSLSVCSIVVSKKRRKLRHQN
jgi:hypothetical protein